MPIYQGNPYVAEEYNPEAFVNCNDYDNFDGVVKRVREIDEDDELWAHVVSQPWQTEKQQLNSAREYEHYKKFMVNIFSQTPQKAQRYAEGWYYSQVYSKWFFSRKIPNSGIFSRLLNALKYFLFDRKKFFMKLSRQKAVQNVRFLKKITIEEFLAMKKSMRKNQ